MAGSEEDRLAKVLSDLEQAHRQVICYSYQQEQLRKTIVQRLGLSEDTQVDDIYASGSEMKAKNCHNEYRLYYKLGKRVRYSIGDQSHLASAYEKLIESVNEDRPDEARFVTRSHDIRCLPYDLTRGIHLPDAQFTVDDVSWGSLSCTKTKWISPPPDGVRMVVDFIQFVKLSLTDRQELLREIKRRGCPESLHPLMYDSIIRRLEMDPTDKIESYERFTDLWSN